jgi:hypothetical protein
MVDLTLGNREVRHRPEHGQGLVFRHELADQVPKGEIDGLALGGELVTL